MKRLSILGALFLCLVSQSAFAAGKKTTLTGTVGGGTGSSYIEVGDKQYTFGTDSPIANKIFKACKDGDKCTVVVVLDKSGDIDKVVSAKKAK